MQYKVLISFLATFSFSLLLSGQEHSYVHYDVKDGLASSTVYCMRQDKDGFIWFGTDAGLSLFDGTHFRTYTTADGLPDNEIINLAIDSKDRVWIMPFKNSIAYYRKGRIYNQRNDSLLARLKVSAEVRDVLENKDGDLMIRETKNFHLIDPFGRIADFRTRVDQWYNINLAYVDTVGQFNVVADQNPPEFVKFFYLKIDHLSFHFVNPPVLPPAVHLRYVISPSTQVCSIKDKLAFFNLEKGIEFSIPTPNGFINAEPIDDSTVTLNTYNGAYFFNIRRRVITDSFLSGKIVNHVMTDSEGDLWFSTSGSGVYRLAAAGFINYTFGGKIASPISCIRRLNSVLYLGADRFRIWAFRANEREIYKKNIPASITLGRITCMTSLGAGRIIVGSDNGLVLLDHWKVRSTFWGIPIKGIWPENDTSLVVFAGQSVTRFHLDDLKTLKVVYGTRTTCGYKKDGLFYLGTLDGLVIADEQGHTRMVGDTLMLHRSRVTDIGKSPDGTIWFTTNGEGVASYKDGRITANIRESDGLTSNICRKLFIAGSDIWVGTDKGLNRISLLPGGKWRILNISSLDGLNSDIIDAVFAEGSRIFAGTSAGMTVFDVNKIARRSLCNLHITGIYVEGREWARDTTGFLLNHNDNDLQFDFVGVSYKSAGNITYKYRLDGLDDHWKTTTHTSLSFVSLPSGAYTLEIVATNKFGVSSGLARVDFTIDKLLWERAWFRLSVLLLLAGLVWLLFTLRVRMIKKKEAEKSNTIARMAELEQMALRSQMNPHFIFNCLNSIQQYVIDKDVRGVNEFITNFSRLIRQTLEFSTRPRISLEEEVRYISTYLELEKRRFEDKFEYEIVVAGSIHTSDYHIPPMILQPYIENAIRHGIGLRNDKKGRILIGMALGAEHLLCTVEDNGVGRRVAAQFKGKNPIEYQSQGMKLTEKRIGMFNQTNKSPVLINIEDLEDQRHAPAGTCITLFFPLESVKANA